MGPCWTKQQIEEFEEHQNYLPRIMWYRLMGFEEMLRIKTGNDYELDKIYLEVVDIRKEFKRCKEDMKREN